MDSMLEWCGSCAGVREFVPVPDAEPTEYACTGCDAALVAPGERAGARRVAALV
jgi:hypothetical protein